MRQASEVDVCKWSRIRHQFSSVQSLGRVQLFATPWIAALQASLSITMVAFKSFCSTRRLLPWSLIYLFVTLTVYWLSISLQHVDLCIWWLLLPQLLPLAQNAAEASILRFPLPYLPRIYLSSLPRHAQAQCANSDTRYPSGVTRLFGSQTGKKFSLLPTSLHNFSSYLVPT